MKLKARLTVLSAILAAMGLPSASPAGVVLTIAGRQEGAISVQPGSVRVGNSSVKWADVMLAVNDKKAGGAPAPNALHFKNGEVWAGKITKLSDNRITIESASLGKRMVETALLRSADFAPGLGLVEGEKAGVLYRRKGGPIPGTLIWIKDARVAIDTTLGAVAINRDGLSRYVFDGKAAETMSTAADEVHLADGSILRAAVKPGQGVLVIKHATLGEQRLGPDAWRSVRRYSGPALYLADVRLVSAKTFPLIRRPANKPLTEHYQSGAGGLASRIFIWPKSIIGYKLPGRPGNKFLFTARIGLFDGSRGAARVKIGVTGKAVFDQVLVPEGKSAVSVSFTVPGGSDLKLEVDFDGSVRFPCGVTVDNALLVKK